ncbi:MAG: response regulator [Pegethrix bostrychoides GSE-TBD4-15B]|jgi:DNA-binding NtrC family response regulator|uniref:Response regulator n=1 Tax=Pegethrix bostrychoides GSE-TBD4-15B TaxID=2839662 RepID=A0A951PA72_9CYAN|nr:response regulator [Pegethrix bostrychoides GSE-TBD4-15B]
MSNQAILCVDDERIVLLSLRDQITKYFGDRYRYELAESVDEAWEVIDELCLDEIDILIIVSDWLMPGMRGDQFLAQVHQRFPKIVTVLLSGQADETAIDNARQVANLYAYIPKPWEEQTLINVIRSGLEQFDEQFNE